MSSVEPPDGPLPAPPLVLDRHELDPGLSSCLDLLARQDVERILQSVGHETLTTRRAEALADLVGWSPLQLRTLAASVCRLQAARAPLPDYEGRSFWISLNKEILGYLRIIDQNCAAGSRLHETVTRKSHKRFLVRAGIDNVIATARLDGATIGHDAAMELLMMNRSPTSNAERVVVNMSRIIKDLDSLAAREFSVKLLIELYDRVRAGTDAPPFDPSFSSAPESAVLTPQDVLERASEYADAEILYHPAITTTLLRDALHHWRPFPKWSGTVARLAFQVLATRSGYPLLGILPVSRTALRWQQGLIHPPAVIEEPDEVANVFSPEHWEMDATAHVTRGLQFAVLAIEEVIDSMTMSEHREEALRARLRDMPEINHRQLSILSRAIRMPEATFRIRYHQTTHNVVYATARADLLDLVEKGFLVMSQERKGAPFIFSPAGDLRERIP